MRTRALRLPLIFVILMGLFSAGLFTAPAARAAAFAVTNLNDTGAGSLRQAIADAAAAAGPDTISFQAGLTGTITLASTLTINQDVTITGPGAANLTISGNDVSGVRVFTITGGTVNLSGMKVTLGNGDGAGLQISNGSTVTLNDVVTNNGNKGLGSIAVRGGSTLTMTNSTSSNNHAGVGGGIGVEGSTATIVNSTIDGNDVLAPCCGDIGYGGGIYATNSTVTLTNSAVSNNKAIYGGGVYAAAGSTLTMTNSTINNGQANIYGGGLVLQTSTATITGSTISGNKSSQDSGGARFDGNSTVTMTNSTISGNATGADVGGLYVRGALSNVVLRFVTITGNVADFDNNGSGDGGGIFQQSGPVSIQSSIVAGNTDKGGQKPDCAGTFTSQGTNIFGASTGCTPGATDLTTSSINAVLNPTLADNGGPTQTHNLVIGSPALNAGATSCTGGCPPTDQRGVIRPQGPQADIGAFEAEGFSLSASASGPGSVGIQPAPTLVGDRYISGTQVTITATPTGAAIFTGWTVNGQPAGYVTPLVLTMNKDYVVVANFGAPKAFCDVNPADPYFEAIRQLSARGVINGFTAADDRLCFGPGDNTLREQMAALIVRATAGWNDETWDNPFTDPTDDAELMQRVATLGHYQVAQGYQPEVCQAQDKTPPCFGPLDNVAYGQVLLFISRAMIAKGYWELQPDNTSLFPELNGTGDPNDRATQDHRAIVTYIHYAGAPPDVAVTPGTPFAVHTPGRPAAGWGDPAPRFWFAEAEWQALDSYFHLNRVP